jgi:hypothetical protein
MEVRSAIVKNAAPYLESGEVIQAVIPASPVNPWFILASPIGLFLPLLYFWWKTLRVSLRTIVITDRRIMLLRAGRITTKPVRGVVSNLPRDTQIGPARGIQFYRISTLGDSLYIHRRYFGDVNIADGMAPTKVE